MLLKLLESEQANREQFEYLADCLLKRGQTDSKTKEVFPAPSARALMDRFGGSMITANERMEEFHAIVARSLEPSAAAATDFPAAVVQAMQAVMDQAREEAKSEVDITIAAYESEKSEFEAQRNKLAHNLKRAQEALASEKNAHQKTKEKAEADIAAAASQSGDAEKLESELKEAKAAVAKSEAQNAELQLELKAQKSAQQQLAAELERSRSSQEDAKQRILTLERRISELTTNHSNASSERGRLSDSNKELSAELDSVRAELLTAEKRRVDTLERLQRAQAEIYSLMADVSDKASQLKKLQRSLSSPENSES